MESEKHLKGKCPLSSFVSLMEGVSLNVKCGVISNKMLISFQEGKTRGNSRGLGSRVG